MPATPLASPPPQAPYQQQEWKPLRPTFVVASFRGGVGKTALAVPAAELLAWTNLRVLLVTSDAQHDAKFRLNAPPAPSGVPVARFGPGTVAVVGMRDSHLMDLLYRVGPVAMGLPESDVIVVDTPPELRAAYLTNVLLAIPVDGSADTQRNVGLMLQHTRLSTEVILVGMSSKASKQHRMTTEEWHEIATAMGEPLARSISFTPEVLKYSDQVAEAHNTRTSPWSLPRHPKSDTATFLRGIEHLVSRFYTQHFPNRPWLGPPPAPPQAYFPGYDD